MDRSFKLFAVFLIMTQLVLPSAFAQGTTEALVNIMTAFLGQLPQSCLSDFGSSSCMECMAVGKILPLALLTSLFFFAFYYVIKHTHGEGGSPTATELRIAAAVGIVIGLLFLHTSAVGDALA